MSDWAFWRAYLLGYGSAAIVALSGLAISGLADVPVVREVASTASVFVGIAVGVRAGYRAGVRQSGMAGSGRVPDAEPGAAADGGGV